MTTLEIFYFLALALLIYIAISDLLSSVKSGSSAKAAWIQMGVTVVIMIIFVAVVFFIDSIQLEIILVALAVIVYFFGKFVPIR